MFLSGDQPASALRNNRGQQLPMTSLDQAGLGRVRRSVVILCFSRAGDTKDPVAVIEKLCSNKTTGHSANSKPYNSAQRRFTVSVIENRTH